MRLKNVVFFYPFIKLSHELNHITTVSTMMQQPRVMLRPPMMQQPPMATPPSKQPAWQSQPVQMPTKPIYCHPDPSAPPIPSAALESSLMKARELAYVLHTMLKPILIAGISLVQTITTFCFGSDGAEGCNFPKLSRRPRNLRRK